MAGKLSCATALRLFLLLLLLSTVAVVCIYIPFEKTSKDFLIWVKQDLGPWGSFVMAVAYIPLTVLAVPAALLTLGGGYLFGLTVGIVADSVGATMGAVVAFLIGRTIGRSYVSSKLKNYPKFEAISIAIERSGFKIILLLRLAPLLPFNMLNYLLCVTPVTIAEYTLATWLGMMPITVTLVYVGTTLKDLSEVTHRWNEVSASYWVFLALGFVISVVLMVYTTKVAKASLDKALAENAELEDTLTRSMLPIVSDLQHDLHKSLIISVDRSSVNHEN